jgi:mannose-6-phosphate isomerase-like protein (cupin superfamily)
MKVLQSFLGIATAFCIAVPSTAQTTGTARRTTKPKATELAVRDVSGTPLEGVRVTVTGPARAEAQTNASGVASVVLPDGQYRFRFEHEGFYTLERDVTIRNIRPVEIIAALSRAPLPKVPEPRPAPEPLPAPAAVAAGPPVTVSIPTFLDKNFIGRDPLKESILSCMPDAMTRLLQLKEAVARHTHADLDEVIYVVAGDGAIRLGTEAVTIGPASVTTIPRGTPHSIERRGRTPLIVLSTLAGAPCPTSMTRADQKQ